MNIDYAKIIETAHKRKSQLKDFEQLLTDMGMHASNLAEAFRYFDGLYDRVYAIDAEGRALLGSIPERIGAVRNVTLSVMNLLTENTNSKAHLEALVACVESDA